MPAEKFDRNGLISGVHCTPVGKLECQGPIGSNFINCTRQSVTDLVISLICTNERDSVKFFFFKKKLKLVHFLNAQSIDDNMHALASFFSVYGHFFGILTSKANSSTLSFVAVP